MSASSCWCSALHWGFGLLPAVLVLSVITIPYLTKATETSLAQVPSSYRDGAEALGLPVTWTLRKIVLKSAMPGIVTGMLVAIAISISETAPLLLTAGWSFFDPTHQLTNSPVAFLTYPVWTYYYSPVPGCSSTWPTTRRCCCSCSCSSSSSWDGWSSRSPGAMRNERGAARRGGQGT